MGKEYVLETLRRGTTIWQIRGFPTRGWGKCRTKRQ